LNEYASTWKSGSGRNFTSLLPTTIVHNYEGRMGEWDRENVQRRTKEMGTWKPEFLIMDSTHRPLHNNKSLATMSEDVIMAMIGASW
jgi:hypothetical protein